MQTLYSWLKRCKNYPNRLRFDILSYYQQHPVTFYGPPRITGARSMVITAQQNKRVIGAEVPGMTSEDRQREQPSLPPLQGRFGTCVFTSRIQHNHNRAISGKIRRQPLSLVITIYTSQTRTLQNDFTVQQSTKLPRYQSRDNVT